jgi:hypothetical protein
MTGTNCSPPDPPSLWVRAVTDCVNCQNPDCGPNDRYITPEQLDMRRKVEIFKYKKNSADQTKKQRYALAAKGVNLYRKKCWATQTQDYTNPNVNNLPLVGFTLTCGNDSPAAQNIANCSPTTNNDVPGPIMQICYDKTIPLTNYITRRTYTYNGTKFPQTAWKPGDNGFPVGKAGRRFLM